MEARGAGTAECNDSDNDEELSPGPISTARTTSANDRYLAAALCIVERGSILQSGLLFQFCCHPEYS